MPSVTSDLPSHEICVLGFPKGTKVAMVQRMFSKFGQIVAIRMEWGGSSAFIQFSDVASAEAAKSAAPLLSVVESATSAQKKEKPGQLVSSFTFCPAIGEVCLPESCLQKLGLGATTTAASTTTIGGGDNTAGITVARANVLVVRTYGVYLSRYHDYLAQRPEVAEVLWVSHQRKGGRGGADGAKEEGSVVALLRRSGNGSAEREMEALVHAICAQPGFSYFGTCANRNPSHYSALKSLSLQ